MSSTSTLSAYKLEVRPKFSREKPWLFRVGGAQDPYSELVAYCQNREQGYTLFGGSGLLIIKDLRIDNPRRLVDGLVYRGDSGVIQDLVSIKSGKTHYKKKRDEAALEPCYFCFRLEDGRRFGVVLLENQGTSGIKGLLQNDMAEYFGTRAAALTISYNQLVDSKAVEKFAGLGILKDVVLINSGQNPSSRSVLSRNSVGGDALTGSGDRLELHLKKHGGWSKKVWKSLVERVGHGKGAAEFIKAPSMNAIDEIRVVVRTGGRTQRFNILNGGDAPIRYDISNTIQLGPDGYATLTSLRTAAADAYQRSILPVL